MTAVRCASFIVRVVQNARDEVDGVIERVATGGKETFAGIGAIGPVIVKMLLEVHSSRPAISDTGPGSQSRPRTRPRGSSIRKRRRDG